MAIACTFALNGRSMSTLVAPGVGSFAAFSGSGRWRNDPKGVGVAKIGPLPEGRYYIVDRESGGRLGWLRDFVKDSWSGIDHSSWFALLRDDGRLDDETFVGHIRRGEFRLHPVGPMGISEGCVTLRRLADFVRLAAALRNAQPLAIPRGGGRAYGTIEVS
ncbi:DUF2778 domain-containing protein [Sphingomonas faeni]|uniref:DUF2778 domain-containing protein n=1 Tax=Sphingomonas faeni TaxID=185950 RepID=UPI0033632E50